MDFEGKLNELSQTKKEKYLIISFICRILKKKEERNLKTKLIDTPLVVARGGELGRWLNW